jgi:hypothetical protein
MGKVINVGGPMGPRKPDNAVQLARALGTTPPDRQLADTPALIAQEQDMLLRCEAALENLRFAFWAAGKALQIIRDTRLYRESHDSFETYCQDQWDITPQYAGKLIRSWRIAERLFDSREAKSNDLETIVSKKLGFTQAWELVPLAEEHGVDAAAFLYLALIKVRSTAVTAALVAGAVAALPPEAARHRKKTEDAVVAYLASLEEGEEDKPVDFSALVQKAVPYNWVRRLAKKDAKAAEQYLDELRQHIDRCRAELIPQRKRESATLPQEREA